MNELTSQRQTVGRPNYQLVATHQRSSGSLDNIVSRAAWTFVRIQTMLRACRKAVKLVWQRKRPLPNKSSIAWRFCSQTGQPFYSRNGQLARLYANGIFARV
jgi:hypothetical protein